MGTNGLPEMQGFETRRHRGHGEGRKEAEGGDREGGKDTEEGAPEPDWILGVWGKALVRNSVDFVPLCFKKGF